MLNIEHAITDKDVGPAFDAMGEVPELDVMAAYLAYLRSRGDNPWAPYIESLPTSIPLAMDPEELQASPVCCVLVGTVAIYLNNRSGLCMRLAYRPLRR